MEKLAFEKGMDFLMKRMDVEDIITDDHIQIAALMKNCPKFKEYSPARHVA